MKPNYLKHAVALCFIFCCLFFAMAIKEGSRSSIAVSGFCCGSCFVCVIIMASMPNYRYKNTKTKK